MKTNRRAFLERGINNAIRAASASHIHRFLTSDKFVKEVIGEFGATILMRDFMDGYAFLHEHAPKLALEVLDKLGSILINTNNSALNLDQINTWAPMRDKPICYTHLLERFAGKEPNETPREVAFYYQCKRHLVPILRRTEDGKDQAELLCQQTIDFLRQQSPIDFRTLAILEYEQSFLQYERNEHDTSLDTLNQSRQHSLKAGDAQGAAISEFRMRLIPYLIGRTSASEARKQFEDSFQTMKKIAGSPQNYVAQMWVMSITNRMFQVAEKEKDLPGMIKLHEQLESDTYFNTPFMQKQKFVLEASADRRSRIAAMKKQRGDTKPS